MASVNYDDIKVLGGAGSGSTFATQHGESKGEFIVQVHGATPGRTDKPERVNLGLMAARQHSHVLEGASPPAEADEGTLYVFDGDVATGLSLLDYDGITVLTSASAGDVYRRRRDTWVKMAEVFNRDAVDARIKVVPGPVIIVSNIDSYDSTQNRFEDAAGNEVIVPDGVVVKLAQAVYDAAVADTDFTPNPDAVFLPS